MNRNDFKVLVRWLRQTYPLREDRQHPAQSLSYELDKEYSHFNMEKFIQEVMK